MALRASSSRAADWGAQVARTLCSPDRAKAPVLEETGTTGLAIVDTSQLLAEAYTLPVRLLSVAVLRCDFFSLAAHQAQQKMQKMVSRENPHIPHISRGSGGHKGGRTYWVRRRLNRERPNPLA